MKQILKKGCNNDSGFTLLEVLVALAILSVGLLGVAAMSMTTVRGNASSDRMTIATNLAQSRIDTVLALPFNTGIQVDTNVNNNPANGGNLQNTVVFDYSERVDAQDNVGTGIYTRIWNIADNEPSANMKTVAVIVQWTEVLNGANTTRQVTLSTLISG